MPDKKADEAVPKDEKAENKPVADWSAPTHLEKELAGAKRDAEKAVKSLERAAKGENTRVQELEALVDEERADAYKPVEDKPEPVEPKKAEPVKKAEPKKDDDKK